LASKVWKFEGDAMWAKVYEPETFRNATNWKIDLVVDKETLAEFKKSGIQKKVKEKEEGTVVSFTRPQTKEIKGVNNLFAPPKIYAADGTLLVDYKVNEAKDGFDRIGDPILIGNGSRIEVSVLVYDWGTKGAGGIGQRLESIRIIDLIEYKSEGGSGGGSIAIAGGETKASEDGIKAPW
jgi:hypothetical protein